MGIPPNYIDYTVIDQLYPQFSWRKSSPTHLDSAHGNFWSLYLGSQALHPNSENGRIDPNPFFPGLRDRKRIEKKKSPFRNHGTFQPFGLQKPSNGDFLIGSNPWASGMINQFPHGGLDKQKLVESSFLFWLDPLNTHSIAEVPVSIDPTFCSSACPLGSWSIYIIFYQPRYPFLPIFLLKIKKKHIKNIKFQNLWSHFLGFHEMWFTLW